MAEVIAPMTPEGQMTEIAESMAEVAEAMDRVTGSMQGPITGEGPKEEFDLTPPKPNPVDADLQLLESGLVGVTGDKRRETLLQVQKRVVELLQKKGNQVLAELLNTGNWSDGDLKRELTNALKYLKS